ncbi:VCBS repeat-containing protein [Streptomyces sp. NBC_01077]|uniref:FG-GAP repeat domain-containing protein n=1 Tax=Streptomyces sp. NBC_01077 TaxID=2903746 RepID=UPI00386D4AA9|nr:VCBS repeat-containing protein [Streptomyces sp. NBC_01077]
MIFTHSQRARRVAACTALVLSAGMLLTGTASADSPAPRPSVEKKAPAFTLPKLTLPQQDGARAGVAAADATPLPLSDFDGDGVDDLLFRALDGNLYSITSTGNGAAFDLYRTEVAKDIIPIGDQGGSTTEPEVLVLSENGTLTLYGDASSTGTPYETTVGGGWQIYNKVVSPGDVNGDGRADLVARTQSGTLFLYLATGNTGRPFGGRIEVGGGWGIYDQLVGISDGNGDGRGDLYARDTAGTLWFYAGTGNTTRPFATRKSVGGGWNIYNQILAGSQGRNLIARDSAGTLWSYAGRGDGTVAGRVPASDPGGFKGVGQFAGGGGNPYTGKEGVIGRTGSGTLFWYGNTTTGILGARQQISEEGEWYGATFAHLSSMNPDASSDIAQVVDGDLYIDNAYLGAGWGIYNAYVGPGDLSGDGKGDLLARDRSGHLYLYRGNGQGTSVASRIKIGAGWGGYDRLVGAGDHTGDGRSDIVARTPGGDLYLYAGTGVATSPFKARQKIGYGWNAYSKLIAPGDVNGDGKADLLGVTSGGDLYRYLNTAPGKFTSRAKIGYGYGIYNALS